MICLKPLVSLCFVVIYITAYGQGSGVKTSSTFKKHLTENKINGTDLCISLPANYSIHESRGPDFSVYYFSTSDTTDKKHFYGGFYLGNAPGGFEDNKEGCKAEKLNAYLLGDNKEWAVYHCNSQFKIQIITKSKSRYSWATYIHAFGKAPSKTELDNLLEVYSTLRKK